MFPIVVSARGSPNTSPKLSDAPHSDGERPRKSNSKENFQNWIKLKNGLSRESSRKY